MQRVGFPCSARGGAPPSFHPAALSARIRRIRQIVLVALACFCLVPSAPAQRMASTYVDLQAFADTCPQNDPYTPIIRRDFVIAKNEIPVGDIACTEPYSQMPPTEVTDELLILQSLRAMYYMDMGRSGYLPWTQLRLYDWVKSRIGGIDIIPNGVGAGCCTVLSGRTFIAVGGIAGAAAFTGSTIAYQAGRRRDAVLGMVETVSLFAHEARHTEGNGYPHVSGCPNSPTQLSCDETYDVSNLGAYGVAYYIESLWVSGAINLGYSCDPVWQAHFAEGWAGLANFDSGNFVTNAPANISASATSGGPCIPATSFALTTLPSQVSGTAGSLTVGITATDAQAGWTSDSPDSWIAVTSGANAAGSGQAVFTVTPPAGTSTQSGEAIAAGQLLSLACGSNCTLSAPNSIAFGPLPDIVMGAPPFTIAATASSGLPVAFNSGTGSVCTVSGATVTIAATGTCSITASQPGNAIYSAAAPVTQSFPVTGQKPQSIAFFAPASVPSGSSPFTISATASSGLPVDFTSPSSSACTVSGSTVTLVSTALTSGSCSITATQPGDATYAAAPAVTRTFPVLGSTQMRWSIHTVFYDGGSASGYFVLDTTNSKIVDWDLVATQIGTIYLSPPLNTPPFDFNVETSYQSSGPTGFLFQSYANFNCTNDIGTIPESVVFWADLASALTNAGGTIGIVGPNTSSEYLLCGPFRYIVSGYVTTQTPADPPTFSPAPGMYTSNQTVTIADSTPDTTIYYTTDRSAPTTSSPQYTGPIAVSKTETIQAMAAAGADSASPVVTAAYTINIPPNFSVGANPASLTIAAGSQGSITLTVTPQNGFSAAVTFACSGLPAGATCAFNPASVTPNGANGITTTLTIGASSSASNRRPADNPFLPGATLAVAGCLFFWRKRRAMIWWASACLLSGCLLGLSACGGGGGSGGGGGGGGTPPTNATVTVTASSGSLAQTATIALTVTH